MMKFLFLLVLFISGTPSSKNNNEKLKKVYDLIEKISFIQTYFNPDGKRRFQQVQQELLSTFLLVQSLTNSVREFTEFIEFLGISLIEEKINNAAVIKLLKGLSYFDGLKEADLEEAKRNLEAIKIDSQESEVSLSYFDGVEKADLEEAKRNLEAIKIDSQEIEIILKNKNNKKIFLEYSFIKKEKKEVAFIVYLTHIGFSIKTNLYKSLLGKILWMPIDIRNMRLKNNIQVCLGFKLRSFEIYLGLSRTNNYFKPIVSVSVNYKKISLGCAYKFRFSKI